MTGIAPITALSAVTTTGASELFDLRQYRNNFSLQLTGTAANVSVALEGGLELTSPQQIGSAAGANGLYFFANSPVRYVRANVLSISGGSVTATIGAY